MRLETARHPVTIDNLSPYLGYFFVSAPLVFVSLPFAFVSEWRKRKLSPMLLLAATGLIANLALFLNYSTAINWRYFLTGLPAMAPLCASFLLELLGRRVHNPRIAFASCALAVVAVAVVFSLLIRPASKQFIEQTGDEQGISPATGKRSERRRDDFRLANNRGYLLEGDGLGYVEDYRDWWRLAG